jgi:hypothetical protein
VYVVPDAARKSPPNLLSSPDTLLQRDDLDPISLEPQQQPLPQGDRNYSDPGFLFKPTAFAPPDTKENIIFKLQERPAEYELPAHQQAFRLARGLPRRSAYTATFTFRRRCCSCPTRIEHPSDVTRCDCLARLFCTQADDCRKRLGTDPHFVRLDNHLRRVSLPSVTLDPEKLEMSLHWRMLCQNFYYDELKMRRVARPWLRYLTRGPTSDQVLVQKGCEDRLLAVGHLELLEACRTEPWLFWDSRSDAVGWTVLTL